jgi:hypothetical protein
MPLPSDWSQVTLTGKYLLSDGSAVQGSVKFTLSARTTLTADKIIALPGPITATLSSAGAFSVSLAATDDPDITPTNLTYAVEENFTNATGSKYSISIPLASVGGTVDLSALAPVAASGGTVSGLLLAANNLSDIANAATARTNIGAAAEVFTTTPRSTSWTMAATDFTDTVNEYNSATSGVATIPLTPSPAIPPGSIAELYQVGAGQLSVAVATGVTLKLPIGYIAQLRGQGCTASLRSRALNSFALSGDLVASAAPSVLRSAIYTSNTSFTGSVPFSWSAAITPTGASLTGAPTAGNLLLVDIAWKGTFTLTAPSGWTRIDHAGESLAAQDALATYYKVSDGTETTPTWTISGSTDYATATIMEITGQNGTTPINGHGITADDVDGQSTRTVPAVTPTVPYCLAVACARWNGSGTPAVTISASSGTTLLQAPKANYGSSGTSYTTLDASLTAPVMSLTTTTTGTDAHGAQAVVLIAPA